MTAMPDRNSTALVADTEPRLAPDSQETVFPRTHRVPTLPKEAAVSPATHKKRTISKKEVARLGEEIYEHDIRPHFEEAHVGEYMAIDIDSRGWALADDLQVAVASLRAEHSDAVNVWLLRVGYDAVLGIGARPSRRAP